jgi:hypothetical protein
MDQVIDSVAPRRTHGPKAVAEELQEESAALSTLTAVRLAA